MERWADAAAAFERAAEINPERSDTHFYRGHALVQEKRWPEAIAALARSLELEPERPIAHYDLYLSYQASGDQALAAKHREAYEKAAAAQK
jgi:tetratricopeptide (TPR) repeat protein